MMRIIRVLLLFVFGATLLAAAPRTVVFYGDSLTAGYGLDDAAGEAYPALIQKRIDDAGLDWRVVNAGLSGDTTSGGLRRLDWVLRRPADIFVLELGANDGLRGLPVEMVRQNLNAIIDRVLAKNPATKVMLAGMKMPVNMGDYARDFDAVFPEIARERDLPLIPFLLDGVGGVAALNLPDGIHPNVAGHRRVADNVWPVLAPLLQD
ncbi:MAG: arylesterase [Verrucomicrobiota bacterium]